MEKIKMMRTAAFCGLLSFLCACASIKGFERGVVKPWVDKTETIENIDGSFSDLCYKFNLSFPTEHARDKARPLANCIDVCCWLKKRKKVVINLNKDFNYDLKTYGKAVKYAPAQITISVKRSGFMKMLSPSVEPSGVIDGKGNVKLDYEVFTDEVKIKSYNARVAAQERKERAENLEYDRQVSALKDKPKKRAGAPQGRADSSAASQEGKALSMVKKRIKQHLDYIYTSAYKEANRRKMSADLDSAMWITKETAPDTYRVTCLISGRAGASADTMNDKWISCGVWYADTFNDVVTAGDDTARDIEKRIFKGTQ